MEIPVFDLKGIKPNLPPDTESLHRIYSTNYYESDVPIVIDNGSYHCRAGWANQKDPFLDFRNIVARQKSASDPHGVLVGSEIPEAELYKMNIRSPYERNIIQHFHTQEHIFDYIFWSLGIRDEKVSHPILITEPLSAPNYTRDMMLELVFECYSAPAVNFGIDAMLSFRHNLPSVSDGMIMYVGHQSSHIIPVLNNRMVHNCARRINLGCFNITGALLKQLQTRYFYNRGLITWPLAQEIIFDHCYVATNYLEDLQNRIYTNQRKIQLPWSMPAMLSQDVVQKRQKQKQEQAQRLKELMQKRRDERKKADELEFHKLQKIEELEKDDPDAFMDALMEEGFSDVAELRRKMKKVMARLQIVQEEGNKYDLLEIPDEDLSPQQLNRKKMQKIQKAAQFAREEKKARELEEKEKMDKLKDGNPQAYLEHLQTQRRKLQERIETRNKTKVDLQNRHSRASQRRLRALAELGSEKQGDSFGERDEDWEVYREIQKDNSSEDEEDQNLLTEIDTELTQLDPAFNPDKPEWRAPTAEDYQLFLEVDRIRPPEILFQPAIVGLEQAGLAQALENVFGIFSSKQAQDMARNIFITGGTSLFPGFTDRIQAEVQMMRPFGSEFSVVRAFDPLLDSWRGGASFASSDSFRETSITKSQYEECGYSYLGYKQQHSFSNVYHPTPERGPEPSKKIKLS